MPLELNFKICMDRTVEKNYKTFILASYRADEPQTSSSFYLNAIKYIKKLKFCKCFNFSSRMLTSTLPLASPFLKYLKYLVFSYNTFYSSASL